MVERTLTITYFGYITHKYPRDITCQTTFPSRRLLIKGAECQREQVIT